MEDYISGYTRLAGVIANPIKHSLSPRIHNTAYSLTQTNAVYLAFETTESDFEKVMASVKALDMLGVNISMPYKKKAYQMCDELSPVAKLIGVVNTVVQKNKLLYGHNTDGLGFIKSLEEQDVMIKNKTMTILGAGGASRAIICQCALDGISEINVFKRKNETFETVAHELKEIADKTETIIRVFDYADTTELIQKIKESQILVNATQIGMGDSCELPISQINAITPEHIVVDLIYHPLETQFLKEAKKQNAVTINGLGMLIYQAAIAFELMTNKKMPVKEIKHILLSELNEKGKNK
ncbi:MULTISPECIES: shikimate dehydrogenase [Vagococcus]|uniref:Shikimate dehydrogenase (NADP(+)) n=1 Tax=Vagococcus fluvialis bH819 TaxID=1255619 RepID=A0A1X6WNM1_9ENTE|nr:MULTISPECIES: shikimate dehydrogenase [Vagococcus]SLM85914.1 Shikimate/quinate 5-dehydrogenase I beta [Vagococcus fluvialis bH819]HCM88281.1 shikimate dehydrogenase [Vagococcus sp.]